MSLPCLVIVAEASIAIVPARVTTDAEQNRGEERKLEEERELCCGLVAKKRRGDAGRDRRRCHRRHYGSWSPLPLVKD